VEDQYPSLLNETNALDIIFCRNVLMYFGAEQAKRVIQRFHRCLLYGGWLVVSSTEASHILYSQFTTVNFPGAILYRKDQEAALHLDLQTLRGDNESARINQPASGFGDPPSAGNSIIPSLLETAKPWTANLPKEEPPQTLPVDPFGLYEDGRYSEAAEAATALLSDEPKNKKAMILLARILANQGQLVQALEWCEKAIAAEKLNPGSYYLRAIILQEQGGISEAANSLKQALYLDHGFVLAQFVLGNLHRQMGKPRDADKNFQNVRSLLKGYRNDETLPESEGITAGRLREIMERLAIANS
jgi:chemotaxis protein methyltransferase CheR